MRTKQYINIIKEVCNKSKSDSIYFNMYKLNNIG